MEGDLDWGTNWPDTHFWAGTYAALGSLGMAT